MRFVNFLRPTRVFGVLAATSMLCVASADASLIKNGTFDSDLNFWKVTSGQVSPINGTARVGQPGPNQTTVFEQEFSWGAVDPAQCLEISFDYEWQVNAPDTADLFDVDLEYDSSSTIGGTRTLNLLSQSSDDAAFEQTVSFSKIANLIDATGTATLRFTLIETANNSTPGTRIELDNVSARVVPEPATIAVWGLIGLGGLGFVGYRRRTRRS